MLVLGLGALCACGDSAPSEDLGADAGASVDGGAAPDAGMLAPTVQVGTGLDAFEPLLRDGSQVFPLVLGPQGGGRLGGHHVALAARLEGVTPRGASLLAVRVLDESGGERATVSRDPARSPFINDRDLPNLQPRLDDCCLVAGGRITVEAILTLTDGSVVTDAVSGVATTCPQPSQGQSICP